MTFVEVSQDGAGIYTNKDAEQVGFYTQYVATCVVYAFISPTGLFVVHDTGQLSLKSIADQAKNVGRPKKVLYAQNNALSRPEQTKAHQDRRKRLLNLVGFNEHIEKQDISGGFTFVTSDGFAQGKESSVVPIPDRDRRLMINTLNNLFAPTNAQAIPVDLQYANGAYTSSPRLLLSAQAMTDRAEAESRKGDGDYRSFLEQGRALGLLQ